MNIPKIPKIDPNPILNGLIRTEKKLCKCGEEYFGLPEICPNCFEKKEKLKVENENKLKLKNIMRSDLL